MKISFTTKILWGCCISMCLLLVSLGVYLFFSGLHVAVSFFLATIATLAGVAFTAIVVDMIEDEIKEAKWRK